MVRKNRDFSVDFEEVNKHELPDQTNTTANKAVKYKPILR